MEKGFPPPEVAKEVMEMMKVQSTMGKRSFHCTTATTDIWNSTTAATQHNLLAGGRDCGSLAGLHLQQRKIGRIFSYFASNTIQSSSLRCGARMRA